VQPFGSDLYEYSFQHASASASGLQLLVRIAQWAHHVPVVQGDRVLFSVGWSLLFPLLGNKAANSRVKNFVALPIAVTYPLLLLRIVL
jgi:hypothetical protein